MKLLWEFQISKPTFLNLWKIDQGNSSINYYYLILCNYCKQNQAKGIGQT